MLRFRMLIVPVLVAGASACGTGDDHHADTVVPAPGDEGEVFDTTERRRVHLSVTGAVPLEYDEVTDVRVVERQNRGAVASSSVVQVVIGPLPSPVPSADTFDVEVGLVGESYRGPGEYTIPAGVGPAPTAGVPYVQTPSGAVAASVAALKFIKVGPPASETRFAYLVEPCRFTVAERARRGQAACPALAAADGGRVAMDLRWEES